MFNKFLHSLKTPQNAAVLEAIHKGYRACFEDEQPTITLYHGTTLDIAKKIEREGLKPSNTMDTIRSMMKRFNVSFEDIPEIVMRFRELRSTQEIFMTKSKEQAIAYAKNTSIFGGEIASQIAEAILKHLGRSDEIASLTDVPQAVVTIKIPLEKLDKTSGEFRTYKPIPSKYIAGYEVIPSNYEVNWDKM